jgi:hypothetical protein
MKVNSWMMLPQDTTHRITPPTPFLSSSSLAFSDLHDYLHVFDDDNGNEVNDSCEDGDGDEISPSSSHYEQTHHEQMPTRYIYHSEKINSSQPSSPLTSIESNWTEEAIEVLMRNMTDPIGKVTEQSNCVELTSLIVSS